VANDDTPVGSHSPAAHQSEPPIIERLTTGTELRLSRHADLSGKPAILCETQGAMSLQKSEAAHGRDSTPQQFLRLVGCCDPKARSSQTDSWRRLQRIGGG